MAFPGREVGRSGQAMLLSSNRDSAVLHRPGRQRQVVGSKSRATDGCEDEVVCVCVCARVRAGRGQGACLPAKSPLPAALANPGAQTVDGPPLVFAGPASFNLACTTRAERARGSTFTITALRSSSSGQPQRRWWSCLLACQPGPLSYHKRARWEQASTAFPRYALCCT